jgi:hypothetical protein
MLQKTSYCGSLKGNTFESKQERDTGTSETEERPQANLGQRGLKEDLIERIIASSAAMQIFADDITAQSEDGLEHDQDEDGEHNGE